LWFNQPSEREAASASSLDVSAVSWKKMGVKKAKESNVKREPLSKTAKHLLIGLFLVHCFPFILSIVDHGQDVYASVECDCNAISFPRSSSLHSVNARVSVISIVGSI